MSWREQLGTVTIDGREMRPGAWFRGVAFFTSSTELAGGRRGVKHEFPRRDTPYFEDLGRMARTYPVEGYVLGEDYLQQRDQLVVALEEDGPGELVHPYYGTLRVAVTGFRVRESTDEGGIARFAITFEETEVSAPFPSTVAAGEYLVTAAADAAEEAAGEDFVASYSVLDLAFSALESAASILETACSVMMRVLGPVVTATQQLAKLKRVLDRIVLGADSLVRQPLKVVAAAKDVTVSLASPPLRPSLGLSALLTAYGFTPEATRPLAVTAIRAREQANYDALVRFLRTLLAIQAARQAVAETWESYDAALAARDAICDRLDEQLEGAGDASYGALVELRAALVRAVPGEASDLPRLLRVTPPFTVPSLVLAHRLYGNLDREGDLVARNRLPRPGFVPGGQEIEVLGGNP